MSESYSESFTSLVQIKKFSIALWRKHFGKLQQSGNLKARESNMGKNAHEMPHWSQWVVASDMQLTIALQAAASSWWEKPPALELTSTSFSSSSMSPAAASRHLPVSANSNLPVSQVSRGTISPSSALRCQAFISACIMVTLYWEKKIKAFLSVARIDDHKCHLFHIENQENLSPGIDTLFSLTHGISPEEGFFRHRTIDVYSALIQLKVSDIFTLTLRRGDFLIHHKMKLLLWTSERDVIFIPHYISSCSIHSVPSALTIPSHSTSRANVMRVPRCAPPWCAQPSH